MNRVCFVFFHQYAHEHVFFNCDEQKSSWNGIFFIIFTTDSNYLIFLPYFTIVFSLYKYIFSKNKMGNFCGYVWVNHKSWCVCKISPQDLDFNLPSSVWYKHNAETWGQVPRGKGSSFLMINGVFLWIFSTFKNCHIFGKRWINELSDIVSLSNFRIICMDIKDITFTF